VAAGIVSVYDIEAARHPRQPRGMQQGAAMIQKRGAFANQQTGLVALFEQSLVESQHLPLTAAHFPARVEMKNPHYVSLALAYLRKV
jgi:hypothetical protein